MICLVYTTVLQNKQVFILIKTLLYFQAQNRDFKLKKYQHNQDIFFTPMALQLRRRALKEKDNWLDEGPNYQKNVNAINDEVHNNDNSNDMVGATKNSKSFSDIKTDHCDQQLPFFW